MDRDGREILDVAIEVTAVDFSGTVAAYRVIIDDVEGTVHHEAGGPATDIEDEPLTEVATLPKLVDGFYRSRVFAFAIDEKDNEYTARGTMYFEVSGGAHRVMDINEWLAQPETQVADLTNEETP